MYIIIYILVNGAPDWIIEIVSLSSKRMDYGVKLFKYYDSGVKEYWIIDPLKNKITVYNFENETNMEEYTFADRIKVGIYKDLEIDFFEINPINQQRLRKSIDELENGLGKVRELIEE